MREQALAASPLPRRPTSAYVVRLLHRAREYGLRLSPLLHARSKRTSRRTEMTAEDAIRGEHQRQAAAQVSVANVLTSLRLCSTLDWSDYFETVSLVEQVLRRDPGRRVRRDGLPQPGSAAAGGRGAGGADGRGAGGRRAESDRKRPSGGGSRVDEPIAPRTSATTWSAAAAAISKPISATGRAFAKRVEASGAGAPAAVLPRIGRGRHGACWSLPGRSTPRAGGGSRPCLRSADALLLLMPASDMAIALRPAARRAARFRRSGCRASSFGRRLPPTRGRWSSCRCC